MRMKGILFAAVSAVAFGLIPVLIKMDTALGLSMMSFLMYRSIIGCVICAGICLARGEKLRLSGRQTRDMAVACIFGSAATSAILICALELLSSGVATSLHYVYPIVIMCAGKLIFREVFSWMHVVALGLCVSAVSVIGLSNGVTGRISGLGVALALISGCTYGFYSVYVERSTLRGISCYVLSCYSNLALALVSVAFGLVNHTLQFSIPMEAVPLLLISVLLYCIIGGPCYQLGIRYANAEITSLLSTLEPLTAAVFGVIMLKEQVSSWQIVGITMIVASVCLTVIGARKTVQQQSVEIHGAQSGT